MCVVDRYQHAPSVPGARSSTTTISPRAILDRVLERGRLLRLDGASMRTRHLDRPDTSALTTRPPPRHRHFNRPEFPEFLRQSFRNPRKTCVRLHVSRVRCR